MDKISQLLEKLISQNKINEIHTIILAMNEVDIAQLFDYLPQEQFAILFRLLPKDLASEVFSYLENEQQEYLIATLSDKELNDLIRLLFVDDIVEIMEEMPANVVNRILQSAPKDKRDDINLLLKYPKDSAGSIMTTEYLALKEHMDVAQAMNYIRQNGKDSETINVLYILDETRHLIGITEIRDLLLNDYHRQVVDLMDENFKYLTTDMDQEEVAGLFKNYGFLAMPVVDNEMRMVGIVTVDDILQIIEDENEEDFEKMSALAPSDQAYLKTGIWDLTKQRLGWLIFLMVSATLTGSIIMYYEHELARLVILTSFIPLLMDTGGNAGSQASTLIIRGMALQEIDIKDIGKVIWKEFRVALITGIVLAIVIFLRIWLLQQENYLVGITVALSVLCVVILAKITGAMMPMVAKIFHLDPAVMAAPLISTLLDSFALIIYFNIALRLLF